MNCMRSLWFLVFLVDIAYVCATGTRIFLFVNDVFGLGVCEGFVVNLVLFRMICLSELWGLM